MGWHHHVGEPRSWREEVVKALGLDHRGKEFPSSIDAFIQPLLTLTVIQSILQSLSSQSWAVWTCLL